jgi:hypothetical protein
MRMAISPRLATRSLVMGLLRMGMSKTFFTEWLLNG